MDKLKSDILNTARTLFTKYGLRSVSIDDVCKQLRISKKTFYLYFKQKEELIEQVVINIHEQSKNKSIDCWDKEKNKNIIDLLMNSDKGIKDSADEEKKNFTLYYDLEKYYPQIFEEELERGQKERIEIMTKIIKRGIAEKLFRSDLNIDLMSQYISLQFKTMMTIRRNKKKIAHQQLFDLLLDIVVRVLANEKGMEYYLTNYYNKKAI